MESSFLKWVTRLVHGHRQRLANVGRREGLGAEDAFEVVQEAFQSYLLLPQARSLVESEEDSAALLGALVRNGARNRRRRHDRAREHVPVPEGLRDDLPPVDELIAQAEEHVRVLGCVNKLGEVQRLVVTLRMLDEIPGDEVAQELGTNPGNVAVLLHRAKINLRICLEATPAGLVAG